MYNAVDLFSGAGGMSIGASWAGIKIEIAVEKDSNAAATYSYNHPDTEVICEDIREVNLNLKIKEPFILFGGPPCQGFSFSNTKTRNIKNENNSLFTEFVKQIKDLKPKWFVFENVEGFAFFEKGIIIDNMKNSLEKLGYNINYKVLLASDYGVPQNRNRFFMVGNRANIKFSFPEIEDKKVNVSQALSGLPILKNGEKINSLPYKDGKISAYAKKMKGSSKSSRQNFVSRNEDYILERDRHIKPGQNWKAIPKELMRNYKNLSNCHSGIYRRLDPSKPSVVIANYRKNMLIHPFEDRGLSVREAARIQSFPDDFIFQGTLMHIQQQIGNAVPPLMAKKIFQHILKTDMESN